MLDDIETYIEDWHNSDEDVEIYEFLGMTEDEYMSWIEEPRLLRSIIFAIDNNITFRDAVQRESIAARATCSPKDLEAIEKWLTKNGYK